MNDVPWRPPAETIPACINWWAEATPAAPALLGVRGERVSFGQLQEVIDRISFALGAHAIERRHHVVLALPPGVSGAIATLAVTSSAVAIPVNPAASLREAADTVESVQPRALIVAQDADTPFRDAAARTRSLVLELDQTGRIIAESGAADPPSSLIRETGEDDPTLILLTSGTTDQSRYVPVRHQHLFATSSARAMSRSASPEDRYLGSAPVHFLMGLVSIIEALISGGSAIVSSPPEIMRHPEIIRDLAPNWTWMPPALLEIVLEAALEHPASWEWPLRLVRVGGALVTPDLIARTQALWNAPVLGSYGSTEALGIASEESLVGIPRKRGSVGVVRAGVEVVIRSDVGSALPPGTTGEITVRGPGVFSGYLGELEATAAAFFPGGWYRTGDLGYLDDEGYLFVTGRKKEMINRGGSKIAPTEIDEVLRTHPAVADAAAFGIPDSRLGEEVAAAVVLREEAALDARALRRWTAGRLSPHKIPRRIRFVDEIPRTATGKVQCGALSRRFGEPIDASSA